MSAAGEKPDVLAAGKRPDAIEACSCWRCDVPACGCAVPEDGMQSESASEGDKDIWTLQLSVEKGEVLAGDVLFPLIAIEGGSAWR